jgi:beta-mannosidase
MKKIDLNGIWRMTGNGYDVEGTVPGSVYSFLHVENKILPDPYYRDNEDLYTSLMYEEYTFERSFDYEKGAEQGVALVFEGLDTLCSVYLNGKLVGETENMHVRYEFDVRDVLHSGKNLLQVVCHPVLSYMKAKNLENRLFGAYDCMEGYPHVRKAHCMMGWDWGPRLPDAGIWRSVYLLEKDSAEPLDVEFLQRHEEGRVFLTPKIECDGGEIQIKMLSPDGDEAFLTANAENEIENPKLWWPNGLGMQNLYKLNGKRINTTELEI